MNEPKTLPFYMAYPMPISYTQDKGMVKDLEYFQQIYPKGAKLLQKEIYQMLQMLDYEGSILYDEYPDRIALLNLSKSMLRKMKNKKDNLPEEFQKLLENDCIEEYVTLVLLCEILKRRHKDDKGYLLF